MEGGAGSCFKSSQRPAQGRVNTNGLRASERLKGAALFNW